MEKTKQIWTEETNKQQFKPSIHARENRQTFSVEPMAQCPHIKFNTHVTHISFFCLSFWLFLIQASGKRTLLCREIAREVVGLSPYERRILDMIKTGGSAADKRVYKFAKRRLGSHKRAIQKREDIKAVNSMQRARAAGA